MYIQVGLQGINAAVASEVGFPGGVSLIASKAMERALLVKQWNRFPSPPAPASHPPANRKMRYPKTRYPPQAHNV